MQLYLPGNGFTMGNRPPPPGDSDENGDGPGYFAMEARRDWIAEGGGPSLDVLPVGATGPTVSTGHQLPPEHPASPAVIGPQGAPSLAPHLAPHTPAPDPQSGGSGGSPAATQVPTYQVAHHVGVQSPAYQAEVQGAPTSVPRSRLNVDEGLGIHAGMVGQARPVVEHGPVPSAVEGGAPNASIVNRASIGVFEVGLPSGASARMDSFARSLAHGSQSALGVQPSQGVRDFAGAGGGARGGIGGGVGGILPGKSLVFVPRADVPCEMDPISKAYFVGQSVRFTVPKRPSESNPPMEFTGTQLSGEFDAIPCEPVPLSLSVTDLYQLVYPCGCQQTCPRYIPSIEDGDRDRAFAAAANVRWKFKRWSQAEGCFTDRTVGNEPCGRENVYSEVPLPAVLYSPPPLAIDTPATRPAARTREVVLEIEITPKAGTLLTVGHYGTTGPLKFVLTLNISRTKGGETFAYQDVYKYKWTLALSSGQSLVKQAPQKSKTCGCEDGSSLTDSAPRVGAIVTPGTVLQGPGTFLFSVFGDDAATINYSCNDTSSDMCKGGASEKRKNHPALLKFQWTVTDAGGRQMGVFPLGKEGQSVAWRPPADLLDLAGNRRGSGILSKPGNTVDLTVQVRVANLRSGKSAESKTTIKMGFRPVPMYVLVLHGAFAPQPGMTKRVRDWICRYLWPGTIVEDKDPAPTTFLAKDMGLRVAWQVVQQLIKRGPNQGIILVGHSLGASAATLAANTLARLGIGVDDLLLFDRYFTARQSEIEELNPFVSTDDRADLSRIARQDVVRRYHQRAGKAELVEFKGGGTRTTAQGRAPYDEEIIPSAGHVDILFNATPYLRVANVWRGLESDMPVVPVNACRPNLTPERLREFAASIAAEGKKMTGKSTWSPAIKNVSSSTYPCSSGGR